MKTNAKPIAALSGALLALALLCQTTQAQGIVAGSPTDNLILGSTTVANTTSTDLTVDSWVTLTGNVYTYDYVVNNPSGDTDSVGFYSVSFNADGTGEYISGTQTGGIVNEDNHANGLGWILPNIAPGSSSVTLSFQSYNGPILGNGNASDSGSAPSPWASSSSLTPGGQPFLGQQDYVPSPVPEPTTLSLLAGCLVLMSFRSVLRKHRE
jgi:hypothetical protein